VVRSILRLEGLAIFLASLYFYNFLEGNWLVFILLLFVPDISLIGYFRNQRLGSFTYNLVHNFALASLCILAGIFVEIKILIFLGLILASHVGMDRFFGFGLKYSSSFKETHIQKL
jgi:hypothetical protein